MRNLGAILLLLAVAGCANAAPASAPAAASPADDARFDDSTGAIRGQVVDEALAPIDAALVALDDATGNQTTTDAAGVFTFSLVPAGAHHVIVQRLGYESRAVAVDVRAGEATEVTVSLAALPTTNPYHATMVEAGITSCGTSIREPGQAKPSYLQICGVLYYGGLTDYDRFRIDYQVPMAGLHGLWAETVWQRNSAASGGYNVLWDVFDDAGGLVEIGENGSAQSPMQVRIERETIEEAAKEGNSPDCDMEAECHLASFHANYGETLGPSAPADASVSVMQRYEVWLTMFYGGEFPASFSAVEDA